MYAIMYASVHIHQCLAQIWKFCEGRRNSGYWNVITPSTYRPGSSLLHTPAVVLSRSLQSPLTEYWNLTAEIEIYWNIVLSLQLSLSTWLQYLYLLLILQNSFSLKFWALAEKSFIILPSWRTCCLYFIFCWGNQIKTRRDTDWPRPPLLTAWAPASSLSAPWTLYEVLLPSPRSRGTGTQPDNYIISATLWYSRNRAAFLLVGGRQFWIQIGLTEAKI